MQAESNLGTAFSGKGVAATPAPSKLSAVRPILFATPMVLAIRDGRSINARESWAANPWCWATEFRACA